MELYLCLATLNKVQSIPQMARKPSMVSQSQPVPPVVVPSQVVYPNQLTYGLVRKQVPVYGIPQQPQSIGVPVYGILVQSQDFVPMQFRYQPQHGYPPQVMRSQPSSRSTNSFPSTNEWSTSICFVCSYSEHATSIFITYID